MKRKTNSKRVIWILFLFVLIMLALASISLYFTIENLLTNGFLDLGSTVLSFSAIALSAYMILKIKVKPSDVDSQKQKVISVMQCSKCKSKIVREFKKGDYIFKKNGNCSKCEGNNIITEIFKEQKEKKKQKSQMNY